jgi:hypothetical protein
LKPAACAFWRIGFWRLGLHSRIVLDRGQPEQEIGRAILKLPQSRHVPGRCVHSAPGITATAVMTANSPGPVGPKSNSPDRQIGVNDRAEPIRSGGPAHSARAVIPCGAPSNRQCRRAGDKDSLSREMCRSSGPRKPGFDECSRTCRFGLLPAGPAGPEAERVGAEGFIIWRGRVVYFVLPP